MAGLSVKGRGANTTGVPASITGTDGQLLRVSGTTLGFGTAATAGIADAAVTDAKLADMTGLSVKGRSAATTGVPASITGTDGQVLRVSGTTLGFGTVATAGIANDAVTADKVADSAIDAAAKVVAGVLTDATLANMTGLSVKGRSANTTGVPASITGTDGQVLRVSGTTLGFGTIATAGIADEAVTAAKIANRTRYVWVSVIGAFNLTGLSAIEPQGHAVYLPASQSSAAYGWLTVPGDYVSTGVVTPVAIQEASGGTGNVRVQTAVNAGTTTELYTTHQTAGTETTVAMPGAADKLKNLQPENLHASAAIGDHVRVSTTRDGDDVLDTLATTLGIVGWVFSYTADS
jgi:hypothetical protein